MLKFLQKGGYYLLLPTVAHSFFMRVDITCGVGEKQFVSKPASLQARKNHCKVTYLNWKANRKEHTEDLKLSATYHLIMSIFSLFHFVASMKFLA